MTPEGLFTFKGENPSSHFAAELQLHGAVNVDESKWNTKGRNIIMNVAKKEGDDSDFWPRLTKEKMKHPHIHVDWDKWVDEDEEEEAKDLG